MPDIRKCLKIGSHVKVVRGRKVAHGTEGFVKSIYCNEKYISVVIKDKEKATHRTYDVNLSINIDGNWTDFNHVYNKFQDRFYPKGNRY